jgi:hypothetical protein
VVIPGIGLSDRRRAGEGGTHTQGQGTRAQPSLDSQGALAGFGGFGRINGHCSSPVDGLGKPVAGLTSTIVPIFLRMG